MDETWDIPEIIFAEQDRDWTVLVNAELSHYLNKQQQEKYGSNYPGYLVYLQTVESQIKNRLARHESEKLKAENDFKIFVIENFITPEVSQAYGYIKEYLLPQNLIDGGFNKIIKGIMKTEVENKGLSSTYLKDVTKYYLPIGNAMKNIHVDTEVIHRIRREINQTSIFINYMAQTKTEAERKDLDKGYQIANTSNHYKEKKYYLKDEFTDETFGEFITSMVAFDYDSSASTTLYNKSVKFLQWIYESPFLINYQEFFSNGAFFDIIGDFYVKSDESDVEISRDINLLLVILLQLQTLVREASHRVVHAGKWIKNLRWLLDRCTRLLNRLNDRSIMLPNPTYNNIKSKYFHEIFILMIFDIHIRLQSIIPEKSFAKFPDALDNLITTFDKGVYLRSYQKMAFANQSTQFTSILSLTMKELSNLVDPILNMFSDTDTDKSWGVALSDFVLVDFLITREFRLRGSKFISCLTLIDTLYAHLSKNMSRLTEHVSNSYSTCHNYLLDQFGSYVSKLPNSIEFFSNFDFNVPVDEDVVNVSNLGSNLLKPSSSTSSNEDIFFLLDSKMIHPLAMKKLQKDVNSVRPKASFVVEPLHIPDSQDENLLVNQFNELITKHCGIERSDLDGDEKYFKKLFGQKAHCGVATKISNLLDISGFIITPYSIPLQRVNGSNKIDEIILDRHRSSFSVENFPYNCIPTGISTFFPNSTLSCRNDGNLILSFPVPDLPASMRDHKQEDVMTDAFMDLISPDKNLIFWVIWLVPTNLRDDPLPVRTINIDDLVRYQKKSVKAKVESKQFIEIKMHISFCEIIRAYMYTQNIKGSKAKTLIIPQQEIINSFMTSNIPTDIDAASGTTGQRIENISGFNFIPKSLFKCDVKSCAKDALYLVTRRSFWYNTLKMAHFPIIPQAYMKIVSDLSTDNDSYSLRLLAQKLLVRFETNNRTMYEEKMRYGLDLESTLSYMESSNNTYTQDLNDRLQNEMLSEEEVQEIEEEKIRVGELKRGLQHDLIDIQVFSNNHDKSVLSEMLPYAKDFDYRFPAPFSTEVLLKYSSNLSGNEHNFVKQMFSTQETRPFNVDILDSIFICSLVEHISSKTSFGQLLVSNQRHLLYEVNAYHKNKYTPEVLKMMNSGEKHLVIFKYLAMIQLFKQLISNIRVESNMFTYSSPYIKCLYNLSTYIYASLSQAGDLVKTTNGLIMYRQELEILSPISYFVDAIIQKKAHTLKINYEIETDDCNVPSFDTFKDEFLRDTIFIPSKLPVFLEAVSLINMGDDDLVFQYHVNTNDTVFEKCDTAFNVMSSYIPSNFLYSKFNLLPAKSFFSFHESEQDVNESDSSKRKNRICLGTYTYHFEVLQKLGVILAKSYNLIRDNIFSYIDSEDGFFVPPYLKIPKRRGVDFYNKETVDSIKENVNPKHRYKFDNVNVPNKEFFTNDTDQDPLLHISESVYPIFAINRTDVAESRIFSSIADEIAYKNLPSHESEFYHEREIVSKCSGFYESWYQFKSKGLTGNLGKLAVWKSIKKKRYESFIVNFMDNIDESAPMDTSSVNTVLQTTTGVDSIEEQQPSLPKIPGMSTNTQTQLSDVKKKNKKRVKSDKHKHGGKKRTISEISTTEDSDDGPQLQRLDRNKKKSNTSPETPVLILDDNDDNLAKIKAVESVIIEPSKSNTTIAFNNPVRPKSTVLFSEDNESFGKFPSRNSILGSYSKNPFTAEEMIHVLDKFVQAKLLPDDLERSRIKEKQPYSYLNDDAVFQIISNATQIENQLTKSDIRRLEVPTKKFYKNAGEMDLSMFKHLWINDQIINSFMALIVQMIEKIIYSSSSNKFKAIMTFNSQITAKNSLESALLKSRSVVFSHHIFHLAMDDYGIILCPYNKGGNHWVLVVLIVTQVAVIENKFRFTIDAYVYDSYIPNPHKNVPPETVSEIRTAYELNDEKIWDATLEASLMNTDRENKHYTYHKENNEIIWSVVGTLKKYLDEDIKELNSLQQAGHIFTYDFVKVNHHISESLSPQQDGPFDCGIFTMVNAVMVAYKHARIVMGDPDLSEISTTSNMFMSNCRISRLSTNRSIRRFFFASKVMQYYRYLLQVFLIDILYNVDNRVSYRIITKEAFLNYSMSEIIRQHAFPVVEHLNVHNFDTLLLDYSNTESEDNKLFQNYFKNLRSGKKEENVREDVSGEKEPKRRKYTAVATDMDESEMNITPINLGKSSRFMQDDSFAKFRQNLSNDINPSSDEQFTRHSTTEQVSKSQALSQIIENGFCPLQYTLYKFFQIDDIQLLKNQMSFICDYSSPKDEVLWFKNCVFLHMLLPFSFGLRSGNGLKNEDSSESDVYAYIFFSGVEPWFNRMSLLFSNWYTDMCNNMDHLFEYVTSTTTAEFLAISHMMYFNTIYPEDETRSNSIHNVFKYVPKIPTLATANMRIQRNLEKNRKHIDDKIAGRMVEYDNQMYEDINRLKFNTSKQQRSLIKPYVDEMKKKRAEYLELIREDVERKSDVIRVEKELREKGQKIAEKDQKLLLTKTSQPASSFKIKQITKDVIRSGIKSSPWGLINGGQFFSDIRYSGQSFANIFVLKSMSILLSRLNVMLKSNELKLSTVIFFEEGYTQPFLVRNLTKLLENKSISKDIKDPSTTSASSSSSKNISDKEKTVIDEKTLPSMVLLKSNFTSRYPELKSIDVYGISPQYVLETASLILVIQRFLIDSAIPHLFSEEMLKQFSPNKTFDNLFENSDEVFTSQWVSFIRTYSFADKNGLVNFDASLAFAFHIYWIIYKEISLNETPESYFYKKYGCGFYESEMNMEGLSEEDKEINKGNFENPTMKLQKQRISNWIFVCNDIILFSLAQLLNMSKLTAFTGSNSFTIGFNSMAKQLSVLIVTHLMKSPFDIFGLSLHNPIFHTDSLNSSLAERDSTYKFPKQTTTADGVYNIRIGNIRPSELHRTFGFYNKFDESKNTTSISVLPCIADYSIFNVNTIGNRVLLDPNTFFTNDRKRKFFMTPLMDIFTQKTNALYKKHYKPQFKTFWHMAESIFENALMSIRFKSKDALVKSKKKKALKELETKKIPTRRPNVRVEDYEYEHDKNESGVGNTEDDEKYVFQRTGYLNRYLLPEQYVPLIVCGHLNNIGKSILANFMTKRNSSWLYEGLILEEEVFSKDAQHYDKVDVVDPYAKIIGKAHAITTFETKFITTDATNTSNEPIMYNVPYGGTFIQDKSVLSKVVKYEQRNDAFLQMDYYEIKSTWQNNWPNLTTFFQPDFDKSNFEKYTAHREVYYQHLQSIMIKHVKVNDLKMYREVSYPLASNESKRWVDGVKRHPFFSNHLNRVETFEKDIKDVKNEDDNKQTYDFVVNNTRQVTNTYENPDLDSGEYAVSTYDIDMTRVFWNGTKELIALGLGPSTTRSHLLPIPNDDMATRYGFGDSFVSYQWISGENFGKEINKISELPRLPSFYTTNALGFGLERSLLYIKNFGKSRKDSDECDIDLKLSAVQTDELTIQQKLNNNDSAYAIRSTTVNPLLRDVVQEIVRDLDVKTEKNLLSIALAYVQDQQVHYINNKQVSKYLEIDAADDPQERSRNAGPYFVSSLDKRSNNKAAYTLLSSFTVPSKNSGGASYSTAFGIHYIGNVITSCYKLDQDSAYALPFSHLTTVVPHKDNPTSASYIIPVTDENMIERSKPNVDVTLSLLMSSHLADFSQKQKTKIGSMIADVLKEPLQSTLFYRVYSNYDMDSEYDIDKNISEDVITITKKHVPFSQAHARENELTLDPETILNLENISSADYFHKLRLNVTNRKLHDFYVKNPWLISSAMIFDISKSSVFNTNDYDSFKYLPLQHKRLCGYTVPYYSSVVSQTNMTPFFLSFDSNDEYNLFPKNFYSAKSFMSNLSIDTSDFMNTLTQIVDYRPQMDINQRFLWLLMLQEGYDSLAKANTFMGKFSLARQNKNKKKGGDDDGDNEGEIEEPTDADGDDNENDSKTSQISGSYGNVQFVDTVFDSKPMYYNYPTKAKNRQSNLKRLSGIYLGSTFIRDTLDKQDQNELVDNYLIKDHHKATIPKTAYIDFGSKNPTEINRARHLPMGRAVNEMVSHIRSRGINPYRMSLLCTKLGRKMYNSILLGKPFLFNPVNKLPVEYQKRLDEKNLEMDKMYKTLGISAADERKLGKVFVEKYTNHIQNPLLSFHSSPANKADIARFMIHGVYHPINILDQQKFECEAYRSMALDTLLDSTRNRDFVLSKGDPDSDKKAKQPVTKLAEDTSNSSAFIDDHEFLFKNISANLTLGDQLVHLINFCDENGYAFSNNCLSNDLRSDVVQFANAISCSMASEPLLQTIAPNVANTSKLSTASNQTSLLSQVQASVQKSTFSPEGPVVSETIIENIYTPSTKHLRTEVNELATDSTELYIKDDSKYLLSEGNIFQSIFGFSIEAYDIWTGIEGCSTDATNKTYHKQKMVELIDSWTLRQLNDNSMFTSRPIPFWSSLKTTTLQSLGTDTDYLNSSHLLDPSGLNVVGDTKIGQIPKTSVRNMENHLAKIKRSLVKEATKTIVWDDQHYKSLSLATVISNLERCRHRDVLREERQDVSFTRENDKDVAPGSVKISNCVREICEINLDNLFSSMSQRSYCGDIEFRTALDGFIGSDRDTFVPSKNEDNDVIFKPIKDVNVVLYKHDVNQPTNQGDDNKSLRFEVVTKADTINPDIYEPEDIQFSDVQFNTSFYKDVKQYERITSDKLLEHLKHGDAMFNKGGSFRRVLMAAYVRFVYRLLDSKEMTRKPKGTKEKDPMDYDKASIFANYSDLFYKLITRPKTITNAIRGCKQVKKRNVSNTLYYKLRSFELWRKGGDDFEKLLKKEFETLLESPKCHNLRMIFTPHSSKSFIPKLYPIKTTQLIDDPNYEQKLKQTKLALVLEKRQRILDKNEKKREPPTSTADFNNLQIRTTESPTKDVEMEPEEAEVIDSDVEMNESNDEEPNIDDLPTPKTPSVASSDDES